MSKGMGLQLTERLVFITLMLFLVACGTGGESGSAEPVGELPLTESVSGAPGTLLYTNESEIWSIEPSTGSSERLVEFPKGHFLTGLAASPDGSAVAFSRYQPGSDGSAGGKDLYVMAPDGSEQRVVLEHGVPGATLTDPAWGPAGEVLYFTYRGPDGSQRIERVRTDGSGREQVVDKGYSPTISADGQHVAYLVMNPDTKGNSLWVAGINDDGARELLGPPQFQTIASLRFAPNKGQIAFLGASQKNSATRAPEQNFSNILDPLRPASAHAHGIPHDLWLLDAHGDNLHRLARLGEHEPILAWSPDGKWVALAGEKGLYLVDPASGEVKRFAEEQVWDGLTWIDSP